VRGEAGTNGGQALALAMRQGPEGPARRRAPARLRMGGERS
jgi:hypothetical protein